MPAAFPSISTSGPQSLSLVPSTKDVECERHYDGCTIEHAHRDVPVAMDVRIDSVNAAPAEPSDLPRKVSVRSASGAPRAYHRIAEVRAQQGVSLRTVSRRTGIDVKELRRQENPQTNLTLSELICWQEALEVPLVDLLEDDCQALSRPVKERAKMVRIMKTVVSLCEVCEKNQRLSRLTAMLREQLLDLMPELTDVGGWPQCGSRRGVDVLGRIFLEPVSVVGEND